VTESRSEREPTRTSVLRVFLPAFILLSALSVLWALASPIFSSPDENAHATKAIAQVHGEVIGKQVKGVHGQVVQLPDDYRYSTELLCFAYHPDRPADCGVELGAPDGTPFFGTWVGAYNPVYYYVVGWPSLVLGGAPGLYAMRIVSALFSSLFLAWAIQTAVTSRRGRWMPAAIVFLASPMILYMAGSVNPQGLEIASAAALWVGLVRLLERPVRADRFELSRPYLWVVVAFSAAMLASARALGPLWVVVVVVFCFAYAGPKPSWALISRRSSWVPIGLIAVAGAFSILWTLAGGSLSGQATKQDAPLAGGTFIQGVRLMLRETPDFIQQAVGVFGWLDTDLPLAAYTTFFVAFSLLAALGALATGKRGAITMASLVIAAIAIPVLVQAYSVHQTGLIWQGRYGIFLYLAIPIFAGLLLSSGAARRVAFLSVRVTAVVSSLLWVFAVATFVVVLRRYVVGAGTPITHMITAPQWQPPLGWVVLVALFMLLSGVFFGWAIRLAVLAGREESSRLVGA